ncbi:hypothetical protein AGDE_03569 [Angomonas deanei]|nr:hypothetical protein AGDE_03569 [Angomonas deanei]|eukprot:EPY40359.1 hypothetical protein AGDE_03569 [Angomonas deanei]
MIAPGASFGCPWGGIHQGSRIHDILAEEGSFAYKGYLDPVPIEKIAEGTYQRKFKWDRGVSEQGNQGISWFRSLPTWRELYFVSDDKIQLVTADKLPRVRSIKYYLGFEV